MCRPLLLGVCVLLAVSFEDGSARRCVGESPRAAKSTASQANPPTVLVGAAKIDITPDYPVRVAGYASRKFESQGVAQKIWAKALAVGGQLGGGAKDADADDEGPVVLLTVDNCGIRETVVDEVARRLAAKAGLKRERIVCLSSHTHSAPVVDGFSPLIFGGPLPASQQQHIDRYTQDVIDRLTRVALEALNARRPARFYWGTGSVGFAMNRRAMKDGKYLGFGAQPDGPVDHRLPILAARDQQGKLLAVVANYACHCTTLSGTFNQIHGDWAGFAQEFLEAEHPGAVALQTIGCAGDADPQPRGNLELCRQHGRELANEVNRLLATDLKPLDARRIHCLLHHIDLPFDTLPTREQLVAQAKQAGPIGARAKYFLNRLERGEELPKSIRYPVATWTMGNDLAMVFLGGEAVVDYAARLDVLADDKRLWVNAYANDMPCYIPSRRVLREGGYEADESMEYYGWPTRLAPQDEDLIVDAVQQELPPRFLSEQMQIDFPPPKSPADSLATIRVWPGLKTELVASEPLIVDPVAFDWGPDGRLWVVEMRDYPAGMDGHGKPGGRVKVLEDTRGDGHFDKGTIFLDDIPFPTGIKVWRKGILVCAAPLIFYAEDSTGCGHADRRVTLFEGFSEINKQDRVNGLRWGCDNWLYIGNGGATGSIKSLLTGQVVNMAGRDLRIRPDDGEMESTSGQTQYGLCRDDWGSWFGGNNSEPFWHYVLDDHYLRRNPHFIAPGVRKLVPVVPGAARVYPISRTLARFNDFETANHFTSACSPEIYRDHWLGEQYYGNSFVCEPVHDLVHRELVSADGVSFTSRRADDEKDREFFAARDNWCRPVMVRTGPDGALWVADMYRFVIEDIPWIPQDWLRRLDVRLGDDKGRIYRVVRADAPSPKLPRLDKLDTAGLVAALESSNGPVRDLAQQMLLWRNDKAAAPLLAKLIAESKSPFARLHALGALDGLKVLTAESLARGLHDPHPGVRRFAIQLRERFAEPTPEVNEAFWKLASDTDPLVQMQFAYALGSNLDRSAGPEIGARLVAHADNVYLVAALMSSLRKDNIGAVLDAVVTAAKPGSEQLVERLLSQATALGQRDAARKTLARIVAADAPRLNLAHFRAIHAVLRLAAQKASPLPFDLSKWADAETRKNLAQLHNEARRIVASTASRDAPHKAEACLMLAQGLGDDKADFALLTTIMGAGQSPDVQSAVVEALATSRNKEVAGVLLAGWTAYGPGLRSQVFSALLSRDAWVNKLLDQVEHGQLKAADFDARSRADLAALNNAKLRARAEKLLAVAPAADRKRVIEAYRSVLQLQGNAAIGRELFTQRCSQCHFYQGIGHRVGPELASVKDRSAPTLLVRILNPNAAIESRYTAYRVELVDGRVFSGLVAEETTSSVTLIGPEEKRQAILRSDIESITSTGKTLMPEGFEKDLKPQDVADIIAFVGTSEEPRQFPGNSPSLVVPRSDGEVRLPAAQARIFGPRIVYELEHQNLGWWGLPEDRAEWICETPAARKYRVLLDYACPARAAGNQFALKIGGHELRGKITATESWDDFLEVDIGQIELPAGQWNASIQSVGPIRDALMDLRTIVLVPQ